MDEIEQHLASYIGKTDPRNIEALKNYLLSLNLEEAKDYIAKVTHAEKYNASFQKSIKEQAADWHAITRNTKQTSVLIYIHNATRETFSLSQASWDISQTNGEDFVLRPGEYVSFTLLSNPLKRISNAKSAFRSSRLKHDFTYRSAEHAFRFTTEAKLQQRYEAFAFGSTTTPDRQYSTQSIGTKGVYCSTDLEHFQDTSPYSYALKIVVRNPL